MRILVTGATGFIGSAFCRRALETTRHTIRAFARDTVQRHAVRLADARAVAPGRVDVVHGDLLGDLSGLCEGVDAVVHFAARTFVDHAIRDPGPFISANVVGTYRLLEDARRHKVSRYIQVSTDEVYGSILRGAYAENAPLNPTNPYAASKAGADALAISYAHTFGLHTTVTRTENNYSGWQHPQKVFPTFCRRALADEPLPVYGDGQHVRQWLWVDDHVDALLLLLAAEIAPGQVFHVAGSQELTNIELARRILAALGKPLDRIHLVPDHDLRPGHDRRYALNCDRLRGLGWSPKVTLEDGIGRACRWYAENRWWLA